MPAATAFVGSKKERSVHAVAATAEFRVAATAYSGMPGALKASASGSTAIVSGTEELTGAPAIVPGDAGKLVDVADDMLDAPNSKCTGEPFGPATIVLVDNGGCAAAEFDLHGTLNSRGVFSSIKIGSIVHAEDHTEVLPVSKGTLVALLDSSIRGSDSDSSHHPIHACAHSRLDSCGVGSGVGFGVGFGVGAGAVVSCVVSSGAVDDVDDACMDGSVSDVIHTVSGFGNSGLPEYHDSSCARLNALPNSRVERGHHVRGGIKRPSTGSLCKVRLSAWKKVHSFPAAAR